MRIADIRIVESLDSPAPWRWVSSYEYEARASIDAKDDLAVQIVENDMGGWVINFSREGRNGAHTSLATGQGSEFKVFATVADIVKSWWKDVQADGMNPDSITFTASKQAGDSSSRAKLYARFAKKFAAQIGYHMTIDDHSANRDVFILTHPDA
jgi:hypothetical protein